MEKQYSDYMKKQTGRDEYSCKLVVYESDYLRDDQDQGCGGIILYTENSRIVCPNTLNHRLGLCFEEMLPTIRATLFPDNAEPKKKL